MPDDEKDVTTGDLDVIAWLTHNDVTHIDRVVTQPNRRIKLVFASSPRLRELIYAFETEATLCLRDYCRARTKAKRLLYGGRRTCGAV